MSERYSKNMSRQILIIEDNRDLANLLELHLQDHSFSVELALDGIKGLEKVNSGNHDLVILDLMLPGIDGLEICRQIRSKETYTPIIMLTSKSSELDRVLGLEMGADDYVTKPFSIRELIARVKAMFRRFDELQPVAEENNPSPIQLTDMVIDPKKRRVTLKGKPVDLTAKEFDLLLFFARHAGRVFTRSELLDKVWGYGQGGYEHTVNSHINRLRAKIEADPSQPAYILTVWGVGYQFAEFEDKE